MPDMLVKLYELSEWRPPSCIIAVQAEYHSKTVGATVIEGSSPEIYDFKAAP